VNATGLLRMFAVLVIGLWATALAHAEEIPRTLNGLPLVWSEDFEAGDARWEMTDPKAWAVTEEDGNHVLALQGSSDYQPAVRSPHSIAWAKGPKVGSFVFEARIKQTGRAYDHRDSCLFFGNNGPSKFYYVHIASTADPHAHSIFLVNDAARVSIAQERTNGAKWDDAYHKVRIVRDIDSGKIEVYFDDMDSPIMETVDKTFTMGVVGVGSFDDTAHFDDIRLWADAE